MDFGAVWIGIKEVFGAIVDYFRHFKASALYKTGDMIYAFVLLIIAVVKTFT